MTELIRRGWVWLINSKKLHYFVDGRSLCMRWAYLGNQYDDTEQGGPEHCAACKKKLQASRRKTA